MVTNGSALVLGGGGVAAFDADSGVSPTRAPAATAGRAQGRAGLPPAV